MNSDEFVCKLSDSLGLETSNTADLVKTISEIIAENLQNSRKISFDSFGRFAVKKEMEHIVVNSSGNQRILVPPALVVCFEPEKSLEHKMNMY